MERLRKKTQSLRRGGVNSENLLQVGILPKKGWRKRNVQFLGKTVLPSIFARRGGLVQAPAFPLAETGRAAVTWIGHASFLLNTGGRNIIIDPNWAMWLSVFKRVRHPGVCIRDLPHIDMVLITHAHHDHLHIRSLREIANRQPILVPHGVGSLVQRRGFSEVHEMAYWDKREEEGIEIVFTPAAHWGARFVHDTHRQFGGYLVKAPGICIYHAGDSAMFGGFEEIGRHHPIDVALMPIGAYSAPSGREVHMNPEEALDAFEQLGAKIMVPMHYGTFPLGSEPMEEPVTRLRIEAERRGLLDRVIVMPEGVPHIF
ncbi:hypothetical protein BH23VER1_BH23VER1_11010 [soil metagenome]